MNGLLSNPAFELFFRYVLPIPAILLAMSVHELCHGFVAEKCGDPTPRAMGRISMNPFRHINPYGFICLMLIGFGAANPVQVNPHNFKHPRRDMALVALAGPLSNLVLAFLGAGLFVLYLAFGYPLLESMQGLAYTLALLLQSFCMINLGFFAFNLIPLPPLDGSHILFACLPRKWEMKIRRYEHILSYVAIGLILLSIASNYIPILPDILSLTLGAVRSFFYNLFIGFWDMVLGGVL